MSLPDGNLKRMNDTPDKSNILLIDDDRELCTMLQDFLAPDGLDVTIRHNGEDGLALLSTSQFDLLILDIMLPGQSGLEVLKRLRRSVNIPVIMLTARGEDVDRIIGLEFGADDYLTKPFNPRELAARCMGCGNQRSQAGRLYPDQPDPGRRNGVHIAADDHLERFRGL